MTTKQARIEEIRIDLQAITTFTHNLSADLILLTARPEMVFMRGRDVMLKTPEGTSFGRKTQAVKMNLSSEIAGVHALLNQMEDELRQLAAGDGGGAKR